MQGGTDAFLPDAGGRRTLPPSLKHLFLGEKGLESTFRPSKHVRVLPIVGVMLFPLPQLVKTVSQV